MTRRPPSDPPLAPIAARRPRAARASAFALGLLRDGALPALSGVLYFLSWIGFGIWPLAFICFLPLLYSLRDATPRQALRRGAWMGFITHLGGYTWIIHLLTVFAFLPTPLAALGYLLICAAQGFLFGVFAYVLQKTRLRTGWPLALLVPVALCAVEWIYPLLFQSYTGVSLLPATPLVQLADIGGVLLVSALQAVINGALADALLWFAALKAARPAGPARPFPAASLVAALLSLGAALAYGEWRMVELQERELLAPKLQVGLAQPDVGEIELHQRPMASVRALWNETAELQVRGAQLVIWPEAAFDIQLVDIDRPQDGKKIADNIPVAIVAGVMRGERRSRKVWNSAVVISPDGALGDHYDKIELLAFGEYIPLGDIFPILYKWSPLASPLARGQTVAPLRDGPWLLATSICYEGILPRAISRTMDAHDGQGGRAHLLVNLTNDSWYGGGHEQLQHLMLAAMRTIEHRRWLARATSTGISAFVDSMGRLVQIIPQDTAGVALHSVPMLTGTTIYERVGDFPGYLSLITLISVFIRARLRKQVPAA